MKVCRHYTYLVRGDSSEKPFYLSRHSSAYNSVRGSSAGRSHHLPRSTCRSCLHRSYSGAHGCGRKTCAVSRSYFGRRRYQADLCFRREAHTGYRGATSCTTKGHTLGHSGERPQYPRAKSALWHRQRAGRRTQQYNSSDYPASSGRKRAVNWRKGLRQAFHRDHY